MSRKCVADIEANGLLHTITRIWCGVFIDIETEEVFAFRPDQMEEMKQFMDNCSVLIMHNGLGFDWPALEKVLGYKFKGTKVDSLAMSRLMFYNISRPKGTNAGPHSVEAWGIRFGLHKPEHEDWSQFSEEMLHRCTEDAKIQLRIYRRCLQRMRQQGWPKHSLEMTFKLFEIFSLQEQYGWLIDRPLIDKYIAQLERWITLIDRVLVPNLPYVCEKGETKTNGEYNYVRKPFKQDGSYTAQVLRYFPDVNDTKIVGNQFSRVDFRKVKLSSDKEVKDMLLSDGWIPKEWNYKKDPATGKPMQGADGKPIKTSPKLSADDPFVGVNGKVGRLIAKRTTVQHRLSVLKGLRDNIKPNGRLSQVITGIAATGRLTHGGIVNIPSPDAFYGKQMRKIFTSRPGYKIIGTDAKSCQDRMLAARANNQDFTDMLLNGDKDKGTDSHSLARNAINEVLRKYNLEEISRKIAKNFNYGWKFGASDNKLAKMAKGTKEVGAAIRAALEKVFPAQAELIDRLTKEWRSTAEVYQNDWGKMDYRNGTIRGLDGRPIRIASEHQILVYMLQSDEAIMMQAAACKFYADCKRKGWRHGHEYGFIASVHDEYNVEVKEELAEEAAKMTEDSIAWASRHFQLACAQEGEAEIGDNWYEVH